MPNQNLKVAVLLSGGVDSSVALRLLHAAGHSCTAFYLKIWFQVDVPLEVVHLTDEYWKNVVSYIIEEYRCGRTPNPDVLCNTRIKFDQMDKPSILKLSNDMVKDQTYFLSHLSQSQLKRLIFPLGCIPKDEVRYLAKKFDLPNKDRKDSQGICFLGKVRHGPGFYNCSLTMECGKDGHEVAVVQISEDDQGLAAGQFTAFYEGRTCIGSGVIMESCDDQGFPVCAKALEIAGMRDKSILGKPVKIMVKQEACPKESEHKGCIPTAVLMKQDQCFNTN
ncbi:tRNA-specific 2-thiouridylase MnmA [Camellia lanceoleosa]|uniref:tRNA-specific 2-thiouridylase MnmA n=1 Tax=Camellia lanceoleosa TaxID=1840588 RepID=A0ACC0FPK2_9ERIC|nr:tRNA-specific 2-thiouridylase MnmA [Camellia lanceoleosa]